MRELQGEHHPLRVRLRGDQGQRYEGGQFSSTSPTMRCIAVVLAFGAKWRSFTLFSFRVVGESCWSVGETVGLELQCQLWNTA